MTARDALLSDRLTPTYLSPCEGYFWRTEESSPGSHRIAAVFRLGGCIEDQIFGTALDHLQRRHPKLRAEIIRGKDSSLLYKFGSASQPISFQARAYDGKECPWREEARRLLLSPISATGPFIAFSVLRDRKQNKSVLIISTHHAIADGVSAMMLVDDLLTEYARLEAQSSEPPRPSLQPVSAARAREAAGLKITVGCCADL